MRVDILQMTRRRVSKEEKIAKRERRAKETLINSYFVKNRVFYSLNERLQLKPEI